MTTFFKIWIIIYKLVIADSTATGEKKEANSNAIIGTSISVKFK